LDQHPINDRVAFWDSLEHASAMAYEDTTFAMALAIREVSTFAGLKEAKSLTIAEAAWAMAVAFEAGRSYGMIEATSEATEQAHTVPRDRCRSSAEKQ
jgi:hypothetical protein